MKRIFKYASGLFLTGMLSVMAVTVASAQRGGHFGGGGGGGARMSGGAGGGGLSSFRGSSASRIGIANGVGGVRATAAYSVRGGRGYFAGVGYHGGAFYRPGFGYFGYPHLGFYLGVLPFGYYPFYWGSSLYYYSGGIFYTPYDGGGYQVTTPPVGAGIPTLPENSQAIKIDGMQYYQADGVYYKETVDDKGNKLYVVAGKDGVLNTDAGATDPNADTSVAAPRVGDIINELPEGCRKVILNGKKYFVSPNDIYYEKVTDPNGNTAYRIASLPDDEKGA